MSFHYWVSLSEWLTPHYVNRSRRQESKVLVILLASHVWYTSHRYAVATWTEFNHTQAAAVAEKREGGGGLDNNQNNKPK